MFPFFFLNFIQSLPTGKPNLVTPSLAKLDVDALRHYIPRFQQNMPKEAADAWEGWFNRLDGLTYVPETYNWPVEVLKRSTRTEPAPPPAQISPDLLELREKETQQTREVSVLSKIIQMFGAVKGCDFLIKL